MDLDRMQVRKFIWKIKNFSSIKQEILFSNTFGGNSWRVLIYPKAGSKDHFLIYLDVANSATLPHGWSRFACFKLSVINQIHRRNSTTKVGSNEFSAKNRAWGFTSFLLLSELHDPSKGYLVNDTCLVEVDVSTDRTLDWLSHEIIVETDITDFKGEESVKPALKKQRIEVTKSEETITTSTARASSRSETIESENPTEKEIDTFFTSLESELANHKIDYSQEAAKEALAKIEEALNIAPASFYEAEKFSPLKKALKVLSGSDCSSALTDEQKTELLALEENFEELPRRLAKAMQDKNLFSEKESVKLTLARDLEKSLNIFKESKAELKQSEQKIAALLEQADEEEIRIN